MPKFSIIVPVYKVENFIRQCIESVLNQSFTDFEVLVVDDCGGDNSIDIVEEYAQKDNRIKILRHEHNRGLAAARNTALDAAVGTYIVCLDSDDWMELNCLDVINAEFNMRKTPSIWFNARKYYEPDKMFDKKPMYNQTNGFRILLPDNIAAYSDFTWIKAYTRESIQKYNLHWPEGLTFEDGEFYFEYFTHNPKTYVISDCLINYRMREGSIVREADRGNVKMNDIYTVVRHLRDFWIKLGVYERYRVTILKLIQNRIRMCYGLNYCDDNKKLSLQFLKDIKYPEDFVDLMPETIEKDPLVSIIIPIYNVEKYVEECLLSVQNQTYKNLEILCIDDCGTDDSIKIVQKMAQSDDRIKIIRHEVSKGAGGSRNTGIENALGEFIFFIDSDDWMESDCVSTAVSVIQEKNLNVVFFKAETYNEYTNTKEPICYQMYVKWPEGPIYMDEQAICKIPCHCWNKVYRRSFLIENNIRMPENILYQDVEFSFRIFTKTFNTYMIDKILYVYRIRENSSITNAYNKFEKAEDLYTAHERVYDFLVENNLMEKYKTAYLELLTYCLNNYRCTDLLQKKCEPRMLEMLNYVSFPDKYNEGDK